MESNWYGRKWESPDLTEAAGENLAPFLSPAPAMKLTARCVSIAAILFILPAIGPADVLPFRLGDAINLIPPATDVDGRVVVFAAAADPDGTVRQGTNVYSFAQNAAPSVRRLTNYTGPLALTGVTSLALEGTDIAYAALPSGPGSTEEVHLLSQTALGPSDLTLAVDKEGCVQPLCANCFRSCIGAVHLTADASKVVYAVARQQPFYVVNADGTGLTHLPIFSGSMAPSGQRVISNGGLVVFTSSAPSGPTFAAAATDVYVMNLDGTGVKPVTQFGNPAFFAGNATISADGGLIAFESNFSDAGPEPVNQIWVVNRDGSGLRRLSSGPDFAASPSISADGSVITFLQSGQIKSVRTTGNGSALTLTRLSISAPESAAVSGDGLQVVFTLKPLYGTPAAVYRIPTDRVTGITAFFQIYTPRLLNAGGVTSAGGHGAPSPGSLISVYGTNIGADELATASGFPLPLSLGGISLFVNGLEVPLLAVTPWQINAQLPQSAAAGTASFQIHYPAAAVSTPLNVTVQSVSPENFVIPVTQGNLYYSLAAAFHAGTGVLADTNHPAAAGEKLEIYGLGLGLTDPVVEAGVASPVSPPARARQTPQVQIGGVDATVTFAGLTPGLAGVYQVNVIVPAGVQSGLQSLSWSGPDGNVSYSVIAVQ